MARRAIFAWRACVWRQRGASSSPACTLVQHPHLVTSLNARQQTLALLYQGLGWVGDAELFNSVEYSTVSMYRKNVLDRLHKDRLIEFDKENRRAKISPKGAYAAGGTLKYAKGTE